jgi:hypothetical protein
MGTNLLTHVHKTEDPALTNRCFLCTPNPVNIALTTTTSLLEIDVSFRQSTMSPQTFSLLFHTHTHTHTHKTATQFIITFVITKCYLHAEAPSFNFVKKNGGKFQHPRSRL